MVHFCCVGGHATVYFCIVLAFMYYYNILPFNCMCTGMSEHFRTGNPGSYAIVTVERQCQVAVDVQTTDRLADGG